MEVVNFKLVHFLACNHSYSDSFAVTFNPPLRYVHASELGNSTPSHRLDHLECTFRFFDLKSVNEMTKVIAINCYASV